MRRSSLITTPFAMPMPTRRGPSALVLSMLFHTGFTLLFYSLRHTPRIEGSPVLQRYTVRLLNPPSRERTAVRLVDPGVAVHGLNASAQAAASTHRTNLNDLPLLPTRQTLVQPDAPADRQLPQLPLVPEVVMWSAEHTLSPILSAPPQAEGTSDLRRSLAMPNHASDLADLAIAPTLAVVPTPRLFASATAPLPLRAPEPGQQIPVTASQPLERSAPARIVSLSDRQAMDPILIPLANAAPATVPSEPQVLRPSEQAVAGTGEDAGSHTDGSTTGMASGSQRASDAGLSADLHPGSDPDGKWPVTRISMPRDGQFGIVVVGSSLAEEYPDTLAIWSGRLVYTVYLHVGLRKNWILQYALPHVAEASSTTRPEAPWPYEMVRPELAESNAGAIMVHGVINQSGRFESLTVVSPVDLPQATFVLDTLRQWRFRAAQQNGQSAAVEVLLLIPEENE